MSGLTPITPNQPGSYHPVSNPVSIWMERLVAPLNAPINTKEGMFELADRVKFLFGLFVVVFVVAFFYFKNSSETLETASDKIYQKFDALLADPKNPATLQDLEQSLRSFHGQFGHKGQSHNSIFVGMEEVERSIQLLKEMRENLFLAPLRMRDNGIIPISSKDNNCLFLALLNGLNLLKEKLIEINAWREVPSDPESFREKIVTWMREHHVKDETLQGYLDRAVVDYIEARKVEYEREKKSLATLETSGADISALSSDLQKNIRELDQLRGMGSEDRHHWYLEKIGQAGFLASIAEMYAFSRLYPQVGIHVYREINNRFTDRLDDPLNAKCDLAINIAYNVERNHFDLYAPRAE